MIIENLELKQDIISLVEQYGDYLIEDTIIGFEDNVSRTWLVERNGKIVTDDFSLNGNSGIALFLIYLSKVSKFNYFIFTSKEAMTEPIEKIDEIKILNSYDNIEFDLNDLIDIVFVLSKLYENLNEDYIKISIIKGIEIINSYIIKTKRIFKLNLNVLIMLYELFGFNRKQLMKLFTSINNFLYKKVKIDDFKVLSQTNMDDLIIYLAKIVKISNDERMNTVISKLLKFQRQKKIIPNNKNLLSRLILKENEYLDKTIDEEIYDGLNNIIHSVKNIKNDNLSGLYDIVRQLDIIEYATKVYNNELINNYKNFYDKEIICKLKFEVEQVIKHGDRNIAFKKGVTGLAYYLIRYCDPKIVPCLLLL